MEQRLPDFVCLELALRKKGLCLCLMDKKHNYALDRVVIRRKEDMEQIAGYVQAFKESLVAHGVI